VRPKVGFVAKAIRKVPAPGRNRRCVDHHIACQVNGLVNKNAIHIRRIYENHEAKKWFIPLLREYFTFSVPLRNLKGKGKFVPILSTTPWRRIGKWRYSSTHSLTSALDGGEWSASRPGRFTPSERAPRTHWIGGWVGPRARGGEEKNSQPPPRIKP
jgi:hypothetical protein